MVQSTLNIAVLAADVLPVGHVELRYVALDPRVWEDADRFLSATKRDQRAIVSLPMLATIAVNFVADFGQAVERANENANTPINHPPNQIELAHDPNDRMPTASQSTQAKIRSTCQPLRMRMSSTHETMQKCAPQSLSLTYDSQVHEMENLRLQSNLSRKHSVLQPVERTRNRI